MILFGGRDLESEFGDTWAYDPVANAWTELHPGGTLPTPRYAHELVCDPSRGLLVMFGGGDFGPEGWITQRYLDLRSGGEHLDQTRRASRRGALPARGTRDGLRPFGRTADSVRGRLVPARRPQRHLGLHS